MPSNFFILSQKEFYQKVEESTTDLYYDVHPFIQYLKYGYDFQIPTDLALNGYKPLVAREQKLAKFHPFFHEKYGTCWSFDFAMLNKTLVQQHEMKLQLEVSV